MITTSQIYTVHRLGSRPARPARPHISHAHCAGRLSSSAPVPDLTSFAILTPLVYEIHAKEMQYQTAKHEVCERPIKVNPPSANKSPLFHLFNTQQNSPLMTNTLKLHLIFRIRLNPQTSRQDKLSNRSTKSREKGIERLFHETSAKSPLSPSYMQERSPPLPSQPPRITGLRIHELT